MLHCQLGAAQPPLREPLLPLPLVPSREVRPRALLARRSRVSSGQASSSQVLTSRWNSRSASEKEKSIDLRASAVGLIAKFYH